MKTVLLISPHRWKPACTPHALEHLAHYLHGAGFKPVIIDCNATAAPFQKILKVISEEKPLLIGITVRNLDSAFLSPKPVYFPPSIRRLIKRIKAVTHIPIVVGGVSYSCAPVPLLQYLGADFGIKGGNEESLVELALALQNSASIPETIPGLVRRTEDGIRVTEPEDRNSPLPAIGRYHISREQTYEPGLNNHYSWGSVETKRGCSMSCLYCIEPESKSPCLRIKQEEAVIDEIEQLVHQGINWIWFTDSEFNLDLDASKSLCSALVKRFGNTISWGAYFLPRPFDKELAQLLEASGCSALGMDVGHGDDSMMKNLGKGFAMNSVEKTASLLSKTSIRAKYSALLGGPGETEETISQGLGRLASLKGIVELGVGLRVYPGTPFTDVVLAMNEEEKKRTLFGKVRNNPHFLEPVFYFSPHIARNYASIIEEATSREGTFMVPKLYQVDQVETGNWRGMRPGYSRHRSNELLMLEAGKDAAETPGASYSSEK